MLFYNQLIANIYYAPTVLYWSFGRKSNMENSDKKEQPVA